MNAADPESPTYLTPPEIAATYRVTRQCVAGWIKKGVRHRGRTIRLRALRVGCVWRVEDAALREFLAALNEGEAPQPEPGRRRAAGAAARRVRRELGMA